MGPAFKRALAMGVDTLLGVAKPQAGLGSSSGVQRPGATAKPPSALFVQHHYAQPHALNFWGMRREFLRHRAVLPPHKPAPLPKRPPADFDYAKYLELCLARDLVKIVNVGALCWVAVLAVAALWTLVVWALFDDTVALVWCWIAFEYVELVAWLAVWHNIERIGTQLVGCRLLLTRMLPHCIN
jgi:hypothetical protein